MLDGSRVLVVEREILVAIDIQRALEAAGAIEVVLARSTTDAILGGSDLTVFGLAVIDAQMGAPEHLALSRALEAAGVPVILTTADVAVADAFAGVVLRKPFGEDDLLAACAAAIAARPTVAS
jgi:DNA-binding response OmpR family regulator